MKPFKISLRIGGGAICLVGVLAFNSKRAYEGDERIINSLIPKYKSMGIPTNEQELFVELPDSENAWIELRNVRTIGQSYFDPALIGYKRSIHSDSLIYEATRADLPFILKYLGQSTVQRQSILRIQDKYKKIQFPNRSALDMEVERHSEPYAHEFEVAAYADALSGNSRGMIQNLKAAIYFANDCLTMEGPTLSYGVRTWQSVLQTSLRIVEVMPSMAPEIESFVSSNIVADVDVGGLLKETFVGILRNIRYVDSPFADKWTPPKFMQKVWPGPSIQDIFSSYKSHDGDYTPKSPAVRCLYRETLENWMPLLTKVSSPRKMTLLPIGEYRSASGPSSRSMRTINALHGSFAWDNGLEKSLRKYEQFKTMNAIVWSALKLKAKTGHYPTTLAEVSGTRDTEGFRYKANPSGFVVEIWWDDHAGHGPYLNNQISYPVGSMLSRKSVYTGQMVKVRSGQLKVTAK